MIAHSLRYRQMITRFETEYLDIGVLLEGVSLAEVEYRNNASIEVKPQFYKVGSYLYKIGSREAKDLEGIKCVYQGDKRNCNLDSNKVITKKEF